MKRLTERNKNGFAMASCCRECGYNYCCEVGGTSDCQGFDDIIDRLAAIEDILGDDYDLDRLKELMEADKAGRCVVLPCKGWLELVFGDQEVFFSIDDDYEEEKVREITVRNEERFTWYDEWKTVVFRGTDENGLDYEFSPDEIGKTVFTTREEAEAALEKMKEAPND